MLEAEGGSPGLGYHLLAWGIPIAAVLFIAWALMRRRRRGGRSGEEE